MSINDPKILRKAFFAQYYGQRVLRMSVSGVPIADLSEVISVYDTDSYFRSDHLELRSIRSLTRDELNKVARLEGCRPEYLDDEQLLNEVVSMLPTMRLVSSDYLRSIGILIPFREFSVEEILSLGWAKVVEG